jgi:hypothetical protein
MVLYMLCPYDLDDVNRWTLLVALGVTTAQRLLSGMNAVCSHTTHILACEGGLRLAHTLVEQRPSRSTREGGADGIPLRH